MSFVRNPSADRQVYRAFHKFQWIKQVPMPFAFPSLEPYQINTGADQPIIIFSCATGVLFIPIGMPIGHWKQTPLSFQPTGCSGIELWALTEKVWNFCYHWTHPFQPKSWKACYIWNFSVVLFDVSIIPSRRRFVNTFAPSCMYKIPREILHFFLFLSFSSSAIIEVYEGF